MTKGPEAEYSGASGHDAMGREIVFIAGPDYRGVDSSEAFNTAARLELEAGQINGSAGEAMRQRANALLDHAIQSESQVT